MNNFVHLNCHSNFSLLYGGSTPEDLTQRCSRLGMGALALTDRDGLYGAVNFYEEAARAGLKPIIGCDLPLGGNRLILIARDSEGYRNLCRAVTRRHLGDGPLSIEELTGFSEGLFALCGEPCMLEPLLKIFGDSLYAELANAGTRASHIEAEEQIEAAHRLGIHCVATNRVAFAGPEDHRLHLTLAAIRLIKPITRIADGEAANGECYLKSPEEMREAFSGYPYCLAAEAIHSAAEIADACDFRFELGRRLFPSLELPGGETSYSHLTKLCFEGASRLYRPLTSTAVERLQHELNIIDGLGFTPYFLVVHEIAGFCRERGIPTAGRGSAAGSMVAYVLGITYIDPIEHDLYFERFLSPAREDPPDIDLDISWRRRGEVLEHIYERFGRDRVAMICTYATMKARMAVRDVAKAVGLSPGEIDAFSRNIPHCRASRISEAVSAIPACGGLPVDREPYRGILEICGKLDGFPRHLSVHAGGVVIADRPLTDLVPLERAANGFVITQYDMGPVEKLGLIKMDILGQKGLSVIEDTASLAAADYGARIDVDNLPREDPETFDLLRAGKTLGVFQIESPGMRALLQSMKPKSINELALSIALIRPGAAGGGMKELFLLRRAGREPVVYLHPDLEPILSESLGAFVYQEQVMRAAVIIAGLDPAEADDLRRAMTKRRSPEKMEAVKARFMEGACVRGVGKAVALSIFESLAKFSGYGFPKAHSATYGEFAYQAAYLKAHYPAEFMAAVLSNYAGFYHYSVYIEEAKRLGVQVRLPDINRSEDDFCVKDGALYFGLRRVKGVSRNTARSILTARREFPFTSLSDFLGRVVTTEDEVATLIKCGAFDSLENTRPELLWKLSLMYPEVRSARRKTGGGDCPDGEAGEVSLPLSLPKVSPPRALPHFPDYSLAQKLRMELEYLEASVSAHPLEVLVPGELSRAKVKSSDLEQHLGRAVSLVGWLIAQRRAVTKSREYMQFLTLEDLTGTFEVTIFPKDYRRLGAAVGKSRAFRVTGTVSDRTGTISLIASDLEPLAC